MTQDVYERVHCFPCGGSGRVKGRPSLNAKDRRRRKPCPDCMGRGYTEQRVKRGTSTGPAK